MSESKGCSIVIVVMVVILALIIGLGAGAAGVYFYFTTQVIPESVATPTQAAPAIDDRYAVLIPIEQTLRVEGPLSVAAVRDEILASRFELRKCYQAGIDDNPDLKGELSLQFTVAGSNGKVTAAVERHTEFPDPPVRDCIIDHIKTWSFPGKQPSQSVVKFDILMLSMSAAEAKP